MYNFAPTQYTVAEGNQVTVTIQRTATDDQIRTIIVKLVSLHYKKTDL